MRGDPASKPWDFLSALGPCLTLGVAMAVCFQLTSCTPTRITSSLTTGTSATPSPTPSTLPSGAMAAQIIFQDTSGGSFDAPSVGGGTVASPGSGLQAQRVYNLDGSLLASGGTSAASWPPWLAGFELGISGSNNTSSENPNCANFATASETSSNNCLLGSSASPSSSAVATAAQCGAPVGQFRVSEVDCSLVTPLALAGSGGPSDGVYFRATFNRANLASTENILATLQYSASTVNPGPANPLNCFSGGLFSPESCSDFTWKAYLKNTASDSTQPFLLLIPPTFASVLGPSQAVNQNGGTTISSKQFVIPLASNSNYSVLQVSRVSSYFPGSTSTSGTSAYNLHYYCTDNGAATGQTPLCAGVILYSLTLIRI